MLERVDFANVFVFSKLRPFMGTVDEKIEKIIAQLVIVFVFNYFRANSRAWYVHLHGFGDHSLRSIAHQEYAIGK